MSASQETPHPPATAEFGAVVRDGASHEYPAAGSLRVRKMNVGPYDNNVYVLIDGGEALIVDASAPPERVDADLDGARVVGIAMTHGHPDHTVHLDALHDAFGAPVLVHPPGWHGEVSPVADGDEVRVGATTLKVLHTPGHTADSICLYTPGFLFSGDTLFPAGPGNTNGDAARFAQVMESLGRLFALPDDTRVCPGHGLDTTIGRERPYVEVWRARGW